MAYESTMQTLIRAFVLVLCLMCGVDSLACECRISGKVSKYLKAADIVFLGKVIFTDDDGTGTFVQKTFVHFVVEEAFKGVGTGVHDVWADPGSFTSCYAEYRLGERYLVFAYGGAKLPGNTAAMTTARVGGQQKPLPAGIDPAHPPIVYYAPECTGTLSVTDPNQRLLSAWLKDLRHYKRREEGSARKQTVPGTAEGTLSSGRPQDRPDYPLDEAAVADPRFRNGSARE